MCRPWNYPYQSYRGFITGEISGWVALTIAHDPFYQTLFSSAKILLDHAYRFTDNLWNRNAYRQRNVFLYPPQDSNVCDSANDAVKGDGVCGLNGNTKIFEADQVATTCSDGDIEGPYQGFSTYTQLVGADNALLYQVFAPVSLLASYGIDATEDRLFQSQLTTITKHPSSGEVYRTRTAQSFDAFAFVGESTSASYYRERKVTESEFYTELKNTITEYGILNSDLCKWDSYGQNVTATGSFDACISHLEESFDL